MDVFFYEAFEEEEQALKRYLEPHLFAGFTWKTVQQCGNTEPPAPIISIRTHSVIPLTWATKVSGILSRSTGYDHMVSYLKAVPVDVPCGYLPLYCSRSVAEQAMLLWMALLRKLSAQIGSFARFNRNGLTGQESEHKRLLVVGTGNIGREVVQIGQGLNMHVQGVDLVKTLSSITYVTIEEGISWADVIVCTMNLTSDNADYFNYELLKKTKQGTIFVNVSRGELSSSTELLRLVKENHLGGVGLDVFHDEIELAESLCSSYSSNNENVQATLSLAKYPNVILTPHNAFNTQESVDRKASHSMRQLNHFLENGCFLWPVHLQ